MQRYEVQIVHGSACCTEPVEVEATEAEAQNQMLMVEKALDQMSAKEARKVGDVVEVFVSQAG